MRFDPDSLALISAEIDRRHDPDLDEFAPTYALATHLGTFRDVVFPSKG